MYIIHVVVVVVVVVVMVGTVLYSTDREVRVEASKMALTAMLKSWPGI